MRYVLAICLIMLSFPAMATCEEKHSATRSLIENGFFVTEVYETTEGVEIRLYQDGYAWAIVGIFGDNMCILMRGDRYGKPMEEKI